MPGEPLKARIAAFRYAGNARNQLNNPIAAIRKWGRMMALLERGHANPLGDRAGRA
jgi:hypothetical protein